MALASTTISGAVGISDKTITVASATSVAVGRFLRIDGEVMQVDKGYVAASLTVPVLRGLSGTAFTTHPASAEVIHGTAADFGDMPPQSSVQYTFNPVTTIQSYSADGAIALPKPGGNTIAVLNASGATALLMTLALPTADMDGCILDIISRNGTGAHTVTLAAGLNGSGGSYDLLTFAAGPQWIHLMAMNELWYMPNAAGAANATLLLATIT